MNITEKYKTQKAEVGDLLAIQQLLRSCQLPYEDITADKLEHYFVIRGQEEIVAVIGLEKYNSYGLLRSLAVSNAYRNRGLGKLLVEKLESYAEKGDVKALYLLTTSAASFFSELNYVRIDRDEAPAVIRRSEEFSNICPGSATLMRKEIC